MYPKYTLPSNSVLGIELERRFGNTDRKWSSKEFDRMLAKAASEGKDDFILTFYLTRYADLRIHECFRIDMAIAEQALWEGATSIKGKGGKVCTVPINEQVAAAMKKCLDATERGHKLLVPDDMHTDRAMNRLQLFIHTNREAVRTWSLTAP